jgi:hypothetical protein
MNRDSDPIGDPLASHDPPEKEQRREEHPRRHLPLEIEGVEFVDPVRSEVPTRDDEFRRMSPPRVHRVARESDRDGEDRFNVHAAGEVETRRGDDTIIGLGGSEAVQTYSYFDPNIPLDRYRLDDSARAISSAQEDAPARSSSPSERLLAAAIDGEYRHGRFGLMLGGISMGVGMVLCLNGVAGSTSWTADVLGLSSQVNDAAPGVVLFIIGIFYAWITRPKVKLRDLKDK